MGEMISGAPVQLALPIRLDDSATYENFCAVPSLQHPQLLGFLNDSFAGSGSETSAYIWGDSGSGKSHLLQACCHHAVTAGLTAQYLPLGELFDAGLDYAPQEVLEGLAHIDMVCLDDFERITGQGAWEQAVFSLFNQMRKQENCLLIAANGPAGGLGVVLPDLVSRLGWGPVFRLATPDDQAKQAILQFRAMRLGLELPDDVVRYLLNRFDRSLGSLVTVLTELDKTSLQQQRRLTIPFIKDYFKM